MVAGENDSSCSYKCPSMSGCRYRIAQINPVFMQYVAAYSYTRTTHGYTFKGKSLYACNFL